MKVKSAVRHHHVRDHERKGYHVNDYYRGRGGGRETGRYEGFSAHFARGGASTELTSEQRNRLPDEAFAIPRERAYPVPTVDELRRVGASRPEVSGPRHARNALQRATQHGNDYEKQHVHEVVKTRYPKVYEEWLHGRHA